MFSETVFESGKTVLTAELLNSLCDELKDLRSGAGKRLFPVGSIYISKSATNPASFLGGTWKLTAEGRTIIGAGTTTDANGAEKTFAAGDKGGSFSVGAHEHTVPAHTHKVTIASAGAHTHKIGAASLNADTGSKRRGAGSTEGNSSSAGAHTHTATCDTIGATQTGEGPKGASGNLPPYLTVYIFERTA